MLGTSKSVWGFDPRTIPGCSLWLDAADTTTLTLSTSNVTGWTDKSPLATPFTLSNGSGGSTIRTTYAGLPVVQVSNSCFFNASYSYPLATRSIFFVMAETVHSDWRGLLSFVNTVGQSDYNTQNGYTITSTNTVGSNVQFSQNAGNGGFVFNYNASNGVKNVPFQLYEDVTSNTAVTLFITGSNVYSSNTSVAPLTSTGLTVGGRGGIPNTGALVIAEVLLYSNVLTTSQRQQVEGYLAHKWGVSGYSPTTPLTIPGCQLWLDAADASTVTGTTSVTAWRDKSTNGYSANSFVNSVAYPSLVSNVQNGNSVIQYSAGNGSSIANFVLAQTMSIFMVYYPINQSTDGPFLEHGPDTNSTSGLYFHAQNGNNFSINSGSGQVAVNFGTTAVSNTWQMIEGINPDPANGNTMAYYVNGTTMASGGIQSGTTTLTKTLYINGRGGANNVSYNTYLAELIIFNIAVTTSQRQTIEGYLAKKWGITSMYLVLPSIHPFYSVRPHLRPFHPTDIDGCQLWLDAADSSTVTLSGSNVTQIVDKSSNAYTFTGSAGSYPTRTTTLNGLPVISSSTGQYLQTTSFNQNFTTATFFAVVRPTEDITPNGKSGNGYAAYGIASGTQLGDLNFVVTYANQSQTGDPSKFFIEIDKQGTGFINGALGGASPSTYNPVNTPLNIGAVLSGSSNTNSAYLNGNSVNMTYNVSGTFPLQSGRTVRCFSGFGCDFAETLIYGTVLTTAQRQQVEGYLAHKWGLLPPSSITPLTIPGLALWLDASDPAGTGVVPANGTTISTWVDKSGNNRNGTSTGSPTLSSGQIVFSGSQWFSGSITNTTANLTAFVVAKTTTSPATIYSRILSASIGGNNDFDNTPSMDVMVYLDTANTLGSFRNYVTLSTVTTTPNQTFLAVTRTNATTNTFYLNGIASSTVTLSGGAVGSFGYTTYWVGSGPAGANLTGTVSEALYYHADLTDTQRQTIERYLLNKWGIGTTSSSLISTHPFKSIPPASLPFSPRNISGLQLWLDAADTSSMTFSSGSNLSVWRDKSGYANNFSLTSGTTSNINDGGYSVVNFPSGAIMSSANQITFTTSSAFFIVSKLTSLSASTISMVVGFTNIYGGDYTFVRYNPSAILNGTAATTTNERDVGNNNYYVNGTFNPSTFGSNVYLNVYSIIGTVSPTISGTSFLTLSSSFSSRFFIGNIAEFLYYPGGVTSSQRQQVEGYLAQKWGLTGSLPSSHPFKKLPA